jgi:hypothetical protein
VVVPGGRHTAKKEKGHHLVEGDGPGLKRWKKCRALHHLRTPIWMPAIRASGSE